MLSWQVRRERAGLTQEQLAKRLRKPRSFISNYERGQRRINVFWNSCALLRPWTIIRSRYFGKFSRNGVLANRKGDSSTIMRRFYSFREGLLSETGVRCHRPSSL